jgi:acyl-CoA thioesterase I
MRTPRQLVMVGIPLVLLAACERASKAVAHAPPAVAAAVAPEQRVILFVGTSLTAGLGLDPDQAFPAVVAHRLDSLGESYDVVNAGVSGETSADAVRRMNWLLRAPADVIVLETGANDGLRGLSVDSLKANIRAIIRAIRAREPLAHILLVGMEALPNMGPRYAADFHRAFPEVAAEEHVALLPFLLAGVGGVAALNQADGIHPNARGAQIVADNVIRALRPILDSLSVPAATR